MHGACFPDRLRLPLEFEPEQLAAAMADFSTVQWIEHFLRQDYDGDWSVIALRCASGVTDPEQMIYSDPSCNDYADTPVLAASPYFRRVLTNFQCPLHSVRLMRLGPGSIIKEHRDYDLDFELDMVRIHIPVLTNADVRFRLNGTFVSMSAGSCWYLRVSDPHDVANMGANDRVHLVIDAVVNNWLATLFHRAARLTCVQISENSSVT